MAALRVAMTDGIEQGERSAPLGSSDVSELGSLLFSTRFEVLYLMQAEGLERCRQLELLREEFEARRNDPSLLLALASWGRSPDLGGDRGLDSTGYNAGVVHYFEYRLIPDKSRRYTETEPLTIQGFIDYTDRITALIQDPRSGNPGVNRSALIEDNQGRGRLLLLTRDDQLVVAFRHSKRDIMRIISVVGNEREGRFVKRVEDELNDNPETDTRLNRLGYERILTLC